MSQSVIFISYRQKDSYELTDRLANDLMEAFGEDAIFQDKERIKGGDDWSTEIELQAKSCSVMLVMVGEEWANARYDHKKPEQEGRLRLDDPEDWVRREITLAFKNNRIVIPLLIDGAELPNEKWLQRCGLERLLVPQTIPLRSKDYKNDFQTIKTTLAEKSVLSDKLTNYPSTTKIEAAKKRDMKQPVSFSSEDDLAEISIDGDPIEEPIRLREIFTVPDLEGTLTSKPIDSAGSKPDSHSEHLSKATINLEDPNGPVPLPSNLYIERPPVETDCYRELNRLGALIRLNAARQMGKSSLMSRVLMHGRKEGYHCVSINFQEADPEVFESSGHFLRWFCTVITEELNINVSIDEAIETIWKDERLGNKLKCTTFFKRHLLQQVEKPLVLCLDEVDIVFRHQKVSQDFFSLLRTWYENGRNQEIWQKLRLVISHSREVYPTLNFNESPFNVGMPVSLPEFSIQQVEVLAVRQGLSFSTEDLHKLTDMIGGHPYLVRIALYKLVREQLSLAKLIRVAPTEEGPYRGHLRRHLTTVEEDQELTTALKIVVSKDEPVVIDSNEAFQLTSMGLVKRRGNAVEPLCNLYRQYFKERLQ